MMGSGTGAMLEEKFIKHLPEVSRKINIHSITDIGYLPASERSDETVLIYPEDSADEEFVLSVGDSRQGWVKAYSKLISLATDGDSEEATVVIDLGNVRPAGEPLKGFGGVSNPVKLADMFVKVSNVLNNAVAVSYTHLRAHET